MRRTFDAPLHAEAVGDRRRRRRELLERKREAVQLPFHAHEEEVPLGVLVLIGVKDVGAVTVEKLGDGGDDAARIGTVDEQGRGVAHAPMLKQ